MFGCILVAGTLAAVVLGVRFGTVEVSNSEVLATLLGRGAGPSRELLVDVRIPRVFLGLLVGGGLAVAGAVFQALLRNPLADPFILGISGGAGAGAVLALALGFASLGSGLLPLTAFAGALLAILLVFGVSSAADRRMDVRVLLLAGVVVGSFFAAVIALILSFSEARLVREAILWMMGTLALASWRSVFVVAAYTLPSAFLLAGLARALNLLSIGEETAAYLGTNVERVKRLAYLVASFMTAAGVAVVGIIGFVGLVVPHAIRLMVGSDQRYLLPFSFLGGGAFLVLADLLGRLVLAPDEVPPGVITALLGVPVFLVLLRRSLRV